MNLVELRKQSKKLHSLEESVVEGIFEIIDLKTNNNMEIVLLKLDEMKSLFNEKFLRIDEKFERMESKFESKLEMVRLETKADIASSRNTTIIWTIATMVTVVSLAVAVIKFHG
jgi:hypothetical protein